MKEYTSCKESMESCLTDKYFAIAHLYNEEKTMNMHIHDCYEIYYSISGGRQFLIDNKFYTMQPGDVFFINSYESHYLSEIDQMVHERIVLSIHPDFVKAISTDETDLNYCFSYREQGFSHRLALDKEQQQRFIYYIHKLTSPSGFGMDILERAAFMELLVFLNKAFYAQCQSEVTDASYQYSQQVDQILDYINQNIDQPLSIDHLSKQFFLSESYICRIFKSATGTTINKYLTARRITKAKSLLAEGKSVNEVCESCGFHDYSNFLKAFTKAVGISPKKYATYSTK
ncbi:AraC family transcriptional regulator [Anaerocolumna cellulosilytica]|uniref:AraC family transcriptional regulator n=1 Tax=Anaerocolumna cellulosilytica TaxID=433286 RepID=A0A6S6R286_9FIRM|nr:AraC family transcriptional regulator [Anaerocolumna cellulosilytica]MBB5194358.1 AraC-like DNA-binding protein [Anaerocolumna cellulosilytica]BCJ93301.1 AraC family transcriptional regulator [Anaerocolumna cellulosilytica]